MAGSQIARTSTRDLQPLGTAGQLAVDSWGVLSALLTRELSAAHAALLAEPVSDPRRGEVDWYSAVDGAAVPAAKLAPEAREALQARLKVLIDDIHALGTRLLASGTDGERFSGEMLLLSIQVPDQDRLVAVGEQPVLFAWGHAPAGGFAEPVTLTGRKAPAPGSMVILPPPRGPAPPRRNLALLLWGMLGGSLLAATCAALLLLLDPFGWAAVPVAQCALPPAQPALAAALQDTVAQEGALHLELARLEADAGQRRLRCTPVVTAAAPPPPPPPPPAPPNRDAERAERQGAKTGKLQIILAWDDRNDLDLHVLCPSGGAIDFLHRHACGGNLDVDANGDVNHLTATPVENVFFTDPRPGRYRVVVDPYGMRVSVTSPFRVTIRQEGRADREVSGIAANGHPQTVAEVEVAVP